MTISLVLLLAAFILFVLATINVGAKFNLTAAGLACWVLAQLLTGSNILRTFAILGAVALLSGCAGSGEGGAWTAGDTATTVNAIDQTYRTGADIYRDYRTGYATPVVVPVAPVAPLYAR